MLKVPQLFCELHVDSRRDIVVIGNELRPHVVPKDSGNSICQQRLILDLLEIGLQMLPEDGFKALLLPDVEQRPAFAYLSDLVVILLLLMGHKII